MTCEYHAAGPCATYGDTDLGKLLCCPASTGSCVNHFQGLREKRTADTNKENQRGSLGDPQSNSWSLCPRSVRLCRRRARHACDPGRSGEHCRLPRRNPALHRGRRGRKHRDGGGTVPRRDATVLWRYAARTGDHRRRRHRAGQHRDLQRDRFPRFHDGLDLSDLHHEPASADRARKRHAQYPPDRAPSRRGAIDPELRGAARTAAGRGPDRTLRDRGTGRPAKRPRERGRAGGRRWRHPADRSEHAPHRRDRCSRRALGALRGHRRASQPSRHHAHRDAAAALRAPAFQHHRSAGDVIALEAADRKFTVLGATGNQTLRFDEQEVTLAEALSQSGGLQSPRADRTGVFLYRRVPRDVLVSLGAEVGHIPGYEVTTIFRFDFTNPNVLFTADEFRVADGDILYVADSVNANISNVLSVLTNFVPAPVEFTRREIFDD